MKNARFLLSGLGVMILSAAQAAPPVVSNVRSSQKGGTKLVEIYYDLSDPDGDLQTVEVQVSGDGGLTWTIPASALTGAVGAGVSCGTNKKITWNAGMDWNGNYVASAKVRVTAYDGTIPAVPAGMVYIAAGPFQMGDNFSEGSSDECPVHNVEVAGFFMDKWEVSRELWNQVQGWGYANGYSIGGGINNGVRCVRGL